MNELSVCVIEIPIITIICKKINGRFRKSYDFLIVKTLNHFSVSSRSGLVCILCIILLRDSKRFNMIPHSLHVDCRLQLFALRNEHRIWYMKNCTEQVLSVIVTCHTISIFFY